MNEQDWNQLRRNFALSPLAETPLETLAENVGEIWPEATDGETAADFLDLSWDDLNQHPTFVDKPEKRDRFIRIIRDTMAFDEGFSDMLGGDEPASTAGDEGEDLLVRLDIPADYPVHLTHLGADALEFARNEETPELGAFVQLCRSLARKIVVGGEIRTLLNSLESRDEGTLATLLPYRVRAGGLHLPEALALLHDHCPVENQPLLTSVLAHKSVDGDFPGRLEGAIEARWEWFRAEGTAFVEAWRANQPLDPLVAAMAEPDARTTALAMARFYLQRKVPRRSSRRAAPPVDTAPTPAGSTVAAKTPRRGFWSRLFGR